MASLASSSSMNSKQTYSVQGFNSHLGRRFGHIPGIPVGTLFKDRRQLLGSGVHLSRCAGIYGSRSDGARSIVLNGVYDDEDQGEHFTYIGTGGHDRFGNPPQTDDQTLEHAHNAALVTSSITGKPVRVVRGPDVQSKYRPAEHFRYDGLYIVTSCREEKAKDDDWTFCKFEFARLPNQPALEPYVPEDITPSPSPTPGDGTGSSAPLSSPHLRRPRASSRSSGRRAESGAEHSNSGVGEHPSASPLQSPSRPVRGQVIVLCRHIKPSSKGPLPRLKRSKEDTSRAAASSSQGSTSLADVPEDNAALVALAATVPQFLRASLDDGSEHPSPGVQHVSAVVSPGAGASNPVDAIVDLAAQSAELATIELALKDLREHLTTEDTMKVVDLARRLDAILATHHDEAAIQWRRRLWTGVVGRMPDTRDSRAVFSVLRDAVARICFEMDFKEYLSV